MKNIPILIVTLVTLSTLALSKSLREERLDKQISSIRSMIAGKTLLMRWKLAQDNNFRLNAKNSMINKQSNQRKRSASTQSYFFPSAMPRKGVAFFEASERGEEPDLIYLHLYDGSYATNSTLVLELPLDSSMGKGLKQEKGLTLWQNTKGKFISCLMIKNDKVIGKFSTEARYQILINMKEAKQLDGNTKIWVNFFSSSFTFFADITPVTNEYQRFIQIVAVCSTLFLISVACFKPRKSVYNLSEWMIVQVVAFIIASNLILFGEGFIRLDTNMWIVSFCGLINIALSLFFLRNYEDVVWNSFNNKKNAVVLSVFLFVYFVLVLHFWKSEVFWIYEGFFLFASQISYAYSKGGRGGMAVKLVLTIIITRLPFIYYRFIMEELSGRQNNPILLFAYVGINIILLTFISLQRYFGSRFLIPKELIPDYYNYFQKQIQIDTLKDDCSICTAPLGQDPDGKEGKPNESNDSHTSNKDITNQEVLEEGRDVSLMITPCNHRFHPSCLQDWMEKRLNCPLCRTALPPSEQQRDDSYCC